MSWGLIINCPLYGSFVPYTKRGNASSGLAIV